MKRITKLAGVLGAIAAAAALSLAGTGIARADVQPSAGPWAEIFNPYIHSQGITLCVDDPNNSSADRQSLQLWRCHGYASNGAPQRWVFVNSGAAEFPMYQIHIQTASSTNCIGMVKPLAAANSIVLENCSAPATDWFLLPIDQSNPNSDFQLQNELSAFHSPGLCVAADTFLDVNGNRLLGEPCDRYNTSQLWNLG